MILVEQHVYKQNNKLFKEMDDLCFLSKNLYNATLYEIRQYFFKTQKYMNYYEMNTKFAHENQVDYRSLPAKVSKMVQMKLDKNFKSFFNLLKKKQTGKYNKPVKIPKYLHKTKGRFVVEYTIQAISFKKEGYVHLSKTNIFIKTKIPKKDIQFARIVPKNGYYVIEIGYKKQEKTIKQNDKYASIDLGLNNLMTVTSTNKKPFIINGKPLKSINQYYNKKKSHYQSILKKINNKNSSKRLQKLALKRNNKIKDYLHKSTSYLINQLVSNDISTLIVGYNKNWKQDINIGKVNNQNFVQIPFYELVNMLEYKCKLNGINLILQEESYTSKCSFLDKEEVKKHEKYFGKRVKRGLFKTKNDIYINADVNGSLNIMKKYFIKEAKNIYDYNLVEVCSMPEMITL